MSPEVYAAIYIGALILIVMWVVSVWRFIDLRRRCRGASNGEAKREQCQATSSVRSVSKSR
jgi:hypothetical protein